MTGPEGVGKQRLALWTAQLLLCEAPGAEPCGQCRSCRLVLGLTHADLHWIVPIPRPKAGEPDKQVEEAAESIAEAAGGTAERAALRPGGRDVGPRDGHGAPHHSAGRADAGRGPTQGVHPRRGRAPGGAGVEPGGGERPAQALRGAAGGNVLPADGRGPREAAPHDPVACGAVPCRPADATPRCGSSWPRSSIRRWPARSLTRLVAQAGGSIGAALAERRTGPGEPRTAAAAWLEAVLAGAGPAAERALAQTRLVRTRRVHRPARRRRRRRSATRPVSRWAERDESGAEGAGRARSRRHCSPPRRW